jgi:hypothetical protein
MDDGISLVGSTGSANRMSGTQTKIEVDKLIKSVQNTNNSLEDTALHLKKVKHNSPIIYAIS